MFNKTIYTKHFLPALLILQFAGYTISSAQTLQLDSCQALARENYPLIKQSGLIEKSKAYTLSNLNKGYWPQISVGGQATVQSDVTSIPIHLPGINIPEIPSDQYKIYAELNQPLTDLLTVSRNKDLQLIQSDVQAAGLEVELYKLKDRVNQLYFGILMLDEQLRLNELLKKDLQNGLTRIQAALENGTEYKSNADKLKAELLRADQRSIELASAKKSYLQMLSEFIHSTLNENTILEKPALPMVSTGIHRPELNFYAVKDKSYEAQKKLLNAKNLPKLGVFVQGGWGQPSPVNLFSRDLSSYYIAGLKLNWAITGLYTLKKEKNIVDLEQQMNAAQKETFLFNTTSACTQTNGEINKLQSLLQSDDEIVALRNSIKKRAQIQLENGIITTNDYLKEVNAEDQSRQNKSLHELQLLLMYHTLQTTSGNYTIPK